MFKVVGRERVGRSRYKDYYEVWCWQALNPITAH